MASEIVSNGPAFAQMMLANLTHMKREGFYTADTKMTFHPLDKFHCLYICGFSQLNKPEFILCNVHKNVKTPASSIFNSLYNILKEGTPVEAGHGITSGCIKYIVVEPSESEAEQMREEF